MLNTRDLEERWLNYKIKSYIPHATIAISLLVIVVVTSIFFNADKEEKKSTLISEIKETKQISHVQTAVIKVTETTPPEKEALQIEKITVEEIPRAIASITQDNSLKNNKNRPLKLSPSLDFMKKMQHSSLPYYQEESTVQVNSVSEIVEEVQELDIEEYSEATVVEEKAKKISIKRHNTTDDIRHIIKRFKKNNNPALSLFIAKKYYELGEYHKAYNYALITNEIDREIDASWLVFAKSLVKLNQKEMAIKTLNKYIENSHSSSAKILLDEISSGKFK